MLRVSPWHRGDAMLHQLYTHVGCCTSMTACFELQPSANVNNALQMSTIRCCCTAMYARQATLSLAFQLAFTFLLLWPLMVLTKYPVMRLSTHFKALLMLLI